MGIHGAHSAQLAFSDLRVPRENLLMNEGEGFKVAMKTLDGGRIGIAAQAVGIGRAALEASLKYAQERQSFGKPLAQSTRRSNGSSPTWRSRSMPRAC